MSLGRVCVALTELDGAKTELWRCVAAGDTALLEGQLELLHQQWEELCTKVSERHTGIQGGERERELSNFNITDCLECEIAVMM